MSVAETVMALFAINSRSAMNLALMALLAPPATFIAVFLSSSPVAGSWQYNLSAIPKAYSLSSQHLMKKNASLQVVRQFILSLLR